MFTATGFIVICVAAVSTCTANAVESPPRPCGPTPSEFTACSRSRSSLAPSGSSQDEPSIQSETDRYISTPAQALAYKVGQLKILDLRARAKKELGDKFDIRAFHDEILNGGALPLDVLDQRVTAWIAATKAGKAGA